MERAILNYEYEPTWTHENPSNVYEVKSQNKKVRRCINLMVKRKLIEPYKERARIHSAKSVKVDTQSIINDLCEKINMFRYAHNQEIAGIMVGREHFELLRDDYVNSSKTMYGKMAYIDMGCRKIMNVPIVLNPFIDGVVFCTKDMLKDMA